MALRENGHNAIADQLNQANLQELLLFLKPIEAAAKPHGNSLDGTDSILIWLKKHIEEKESDSEFLANLKAHAR